MPRFRSSHPVLIAGVRRSPLFDADWYLDNYPDVAAAAYDPAAHYVRHGADEGRDPGPDFSTSGYAYLYHDELENSGLDPLNHYDAWGRPLGHETLPVFAGERAWRSGRRTVLLCAHAAGRELFGAERSFLDVLAALDALGFNVIVSLPALGNTAYFEQLRAAAHKIAVLPYTWWRTGKRACERTRRYFEALICAHGVDALHANTIVLDEPLRAARACGIPVVIHARELPEHDPDLCAALGATAMEVREQVRTQADFLVANSHVAANFFAMPGRSFVLHNTIDDAEFVLPAPEPSALTPLSVAMVSSNVPKKGLDDFVELARRFHDAGDDIRCVLIGPDNAHVAALRSRQAVGEVPANLILDGYAASPVMAMRRADVVVNLSRVQESFGRTVLEAMAARRPVVCYDWGALPEIVVSRETGFVVPYRDIAAVAECVRQLDRDRHLVVRMGEAGRERAVTRFGRAAFLAKLAEIYARILDPSLDAEPAMVSPISTAPHGTSR
jgi:glycosyltransferase involved in cell wall biosynthesis